MASKHVFHQDCTNADKEWASDLEQVCNLTQNQSGTLILGGMITQSPSYIGSFKMS